MKLLLIVGLCILVLLASFCKTEADLERHEEAQLIKELLDGIEERIYSELAHNEERVQHKNQSLSETVDKAKQEYDEAQAEEDYYYAKFQTAKDTKIAKKGALKSTQELTEKELVQFQDDINLHQKALKKELYLVSRIRYHLQKLKGTLVPSCKFIKERHPTSTTGRYNITSEIYGDMEVTCDMDTDDGGWLVIDRELVAQYPELMKFHFIVGPQAGHSHHEWYDKSKGTWEIGDNYRPSSFVLTQWAATIVAPYSFTEISGSMQVYGWGSAHPDDSTSGAYTNENFFKGINRANYAAYIVGAHNTEVGQILKDGNKWGHNFSGHKSYQFSTEKLGFEATDILHTTTDSSYEVVRWEEYTYLVR